MAQLLTFMNKRRRPWRFCCSRPGVTRISRLQIIVPFGNGDMRTFLIALLIASLCRTQPGFCKTPDTLVFEDVTVVPMDKERTLPHKGASSAAWISTSRKVLAGSISLVSFGRIREVHFYPHQFRSHLSAHPPGQESDHFGSGIRNKVCRSGVSVNATTTGEPGKPAPQLAGSVSGTKNIKCGRQCPSPSLK
jgi:hypothetical protein